MGLGQALLLMLVASAIIIILGELFYRSLVGDDSDYTGSGPSWLDRSPIIVQAVVAIVLISTFLVVMGSGYLFHKIYCALTAFFSERQKASHHTPQPAS